MTALLCGCRNRITAAHIIGSGTELEIMVAVENHGEDAFNTKLFVTLPPGVSFRNKAAVSAVSGIWIWICSCSEERVLLYQMCGAGVSVRAIVNEKNGAGSVYVASLHHVIWICIS